MTQSVPKRNAPHDAGERKVIRETAPLVSAAAIFRVPPSTHVDRAESARVTGHHHHASYRKAQAASLFMFGSLTKCS
ncbi:MAG: hypothetical protein DLM52_05055 [Chthoniobacterales bacterium]|nr:MAG: hypothetical protein DLM52_05055 [Chthoniobacterales bacterium]